jgi:anaerobic dimethyl sulfoxide reductase subunit B
MTKQMGFYVDLDRCLMCNSCEVACKQFNNIKANTIKRRRLLDFTSGTYPNVKRTGLSLSCMHCEQPACAAVCPTGAISKRIEDGVVVVDPTKCIGCHYCFFACPFGVPAYTDGVMNKCDYCLSQNLAEGEPPRCVATCPVQALHSGTMEELADIVSTKAAKKLVGATNPSIFF